MFEGREWFANPPASADALAALRAAAPVTLPEAYYQLLADSDGGEGPLSVQPIVSALMTSRPSSPA